MEDVKDSVIRIEEEYGENVAEYYLDIKSGWAGSTQINYIYVDALIKNNTYVVYLMHLLCTSIPTSFDF